MSGLESFLKEPKRFFRVQLISKTNVIKMWIGIFLNDKVQSFLKQLLELKKTRGIV